MIPTRTIRNRNRPIRPKPPVNTPQRLRVLRRFALTRMNRQKLVENIGQLYLLQPAPIRLDRYGRAMRDIRDPWRLEDVSGQVARLASTITDHVVDIGLDQIYSYGTDPNAKNVGENHAGLLQLKVQLAISGPKVTVQSTGRPGEATLPPGGAAPSVVVMYEEFAKTGPDYFKAMWAKRSADIWVNLGRRVDAFDQNEEGQIGSAGYVARLCRLLGEEIVIAGRAGLACALQVHQELGMPLEQSAENLVLELVEMSAELDHYADELEGELSDLSVDLAAFVEGLLKAASLSIGFKSPEITRLHGKSVGLQQTLFHAAREFDKFLTLVINLRPYGSDGPWKSRDRLIDCLKRLRNQFDFAALMLGEAKVLFERE
jgi:hypothetical protein